MDAFHLLETRKLAHKRDPSIPSPPHEAEYIRGDPSLRVEVGNSIWSVKANERCAGVLRYDGSPNTSQYAVLRAECGKLVSMHQIGARRKAAGMGAFTGCGVTTRRVVFTSFSWSGSCHPSPWPSSRPCYTAAIRRLPCYTGYASTIFRSPFVTGESMLPEPAEKL